jgi:hypothetical protein
MPVRPCFPQTITEKIHEPISADSLSRCEIPLQSAWSYGKGWPWTGGHGLHTVSPRPAMPYPSAQGGRLLPLWPSHAVRLCQSVPVEEAELAFNPQERHPASFGYMFQQDIPLQVEQKVNTASHA